jgi:hydrogenase nickel incorporation protein HypB
MSDDPRIVEVRRNILRKNDEIARALRERFRREGLFVVSMVSSPGSGKTAFLEKTLAMLRPDSRPAALVGDLAT